MRHLNTALASPHSREFPPTITQGHIREAPKAKGLHVLLQLDCKKLQSELLEYMIQDPSFTFTLSDGLTSGLETAKQYPFDVVFTDICDSCMDTEELISSLKEASLHTAVVLFTNCECGDKEIEYLQHGADYVLTRPLQIEVMIARVKAMMRWRTPKSVPSSKISGFDFKMETKTLSKKDTPTIRLTEKEASILQFLLRYRGKVVSREDLLHHVWGYNQGAHTHTVETHIYRLRKKLEKVMQIKSIILTESRGYRLVQQVADVSNSALKVKLS